jgi:hypothetical protein
MHYELLYASWSAPNLEVSSITGLVQQARRKNRWLGVTSLLAFDGERFCQLVEGEVDMVSSLASTIRNDARHHGYAVLHAGTREGQRRFPQWHLGFAMHDLGTLDGAIALRTGEQMVEYLQATPISRIDFDPA